MPYALNEKARIYYEVEGEGPPLVLVHGLTQDLHDWRESGWVEELQEEYRLVLIDLRGAGASEKSHDPQIYARLDVLAGDVLAVLDGLQIGKAHVFGYSRGTRTACALAKHAPDRVLSLILGGMTPYASPDHSEQDVRRMFSGGMEHFITDDVSPGLIATAEYKTRKLGNDAEALIAAFQLRLGLADILVNLPMPSLLYVGEADSDYHDMREIAGRIPGARFFSLPGLGHGQAFRYSHQALPQIKQFLHEVTPLAEWNRAVVRRVVKAITSANYESLDQWYSPDWRLAGQTEGQGPEAVRQHINQIFSVFADAEAAIGDITADDTTVRTRWVFKGTPNRTWMSNASSETRVQMRGEIMDHIRNGKIVESHVSYDLADVQR